ncbi:MAG: FAD-dependent oxidoreductase [Patescibacteria group bacterium]
MNSPWYAKTPDERLFPKIEKDETTDLVIVGGGIAGIMAAHYAIEKNMRVVLLEKNHIATGDSGATTGFLTRLPEGSIVALEKLYGPAFVRGVLDASGKTQKYIFDLITSQHIDCDFRICNSYIGSYKNNDPVIEEEWTVIRKADDRASLRHVGELTGSPFAEAIGLAEEGSMHARAFIRHMSLALVKKGLHIFEESEVTRFETTPTGATAYVGSLAVHAQKIIIATGRPHSYFTELQTLVTQKLSYVVSAAHSQIPLGDDLYWDTSLPYFYYRKTDPHTMIVGGCDIDAAQAQSQNAFPKIEQFIKTRLKLDNPRDSYTHMFKWSGSLFETNDNLPYVFAHPHEHGRIIVITGFGGNGLVMGTLAAEISIALARGEYTPEQKLFSLERSNTTIAQVAKTSSTTSTIEKVKTFVPFAPISEFTAGKPIMKNFGEQHIVVFKVKEKYFAMNNTCSHAGGSLADGSQTDTTVECPLHGARYSIETGEVIGPPAIRAQQTYKTRVTDNVVEIEIEKMVVIPVQLSARSTIPRIRRWPYILLFGAIAFLIWAIQFLLQFYWLQQGEQYISLVRSFALMGASLIGLALFTSAIFKWFPKTARYWHLRRYLGVAGFIFVSLHIASVYQYYYDYNLAEIYFSLNPLENPIIFGTIAYPILFLMALTSTDWAVTKLKPRRWKNLHRFIYPAYISSIFHFVFIDPELFTHLPGQVLLVITLAALIGQLYWFFKTIAKRHFQSLGTFVGFTIIFITFIISALAYSAKLFPWQR